MTVKIDKSTVIDKTVDAIAIRGVYDYDILDIDGTPLYGVIGNRTCISIYNYNLGNRRRGAEWWDDIDYLSIIIMQKAIKKLMGAWLSDLPDIITIHATPDDSIQADAIDWEV